jgi:ferrochelatase
MAADEDDAPPTAVLVMAYGTPARPEDVEAYYTHVRRGRPPTPEQLADLRRRYDAIGGISPMAARTRAQVAGLQAALDERAPGRFRTTFGAKHAPPYIEDAVTGVLADGASDLVALVLAPHYSALSVGEYFERVAAVLDESEVPVGATYIRDWYLEPGLIDLLAERVTAALGRFAPGARVEVLITAHSLPERVLTMDDPYPEALQQTGEVVAAAAGVTSWRLAWQSAGRTPEPWLGPDILEVIRGLPAEGFDGVLVCPVGFTSDHLEVLFDVDIQARDVAEAAGLRLERTESLNDDPRFMAVLAEVVLAASE